VNTSELVTVADAIVTELNAAKSPAWSQVFTAVRAWRPISDPNDLQVLKISVVPFQEVEEPLARDRNYFTYTVHILAQTRLEKVVNSEMDPIDLLCEEFADFFRLRSLTAYPTGAVTKTSRPAVVSYDHLDQFKIFTSIVAIEVSTSRP